MLTALAHLIMACSRSRSLLADSIRDDPDRWEIKDTGGGCYVLEIKSHKLEMWCGKHTSHITIDGLKREIDWAERKLIRQSISTFLGTRLAREQRQIDRALKMALNSETTP